MHSDVEVRSGMQVVPMNPKNRCSEPGWGGVDTVKTGTHKMGKCQG
jgi:hypothetical protein